MRASSLSWTIEKLGTQWRVHQGAVHVFVYVDGRCAGSVQWGLKNWPGFDYDSDEITPDDFPPEVAPDTLLVRVPVSTFDQFIGHVLQMLESDDVHIYTSAKQALDVANGVVQYDSLPQCDAIARLELELHPDALYRAHVAP